MLLEKPCLKKENIGSLQHVITRHLEEHLTAETRWCADWGTQPTATDHASYRDVNKETRISKPIRVLLDILPLGVDQAAVERDADEAQCGAAAESLSLLAESRPFHRPHAEHFKSLDALLARIRGCVVASFWQTVERSRNANGAAPQPYLLMHDFRSVMQPAEPDIGMDDQGHRDFTKIKETGSSFSLSPSAHAPPAHGTSGASRDSDAELSAMRRADRSVTDGRGYADCGIAGATPASGATGGS